MISFVRIDERLIHGQVLAKWLDQVPCDKAIVIDDSMNEEPFMKSVMRLAFPKNKYLGFYDVKKGVEELKRDAKEHYFVLFRNLKSLYKVIQSGVEIKNANLANIPSKDDQVLVDYLLKRGIVLYVQMVPASPVVYIS